MSGQDAVDWEQEAGDGRVIGGLSPGKGRGQPGQRPKAAGQGKGQGQQWQGKGPHQHKGAGAGRGAAPRAEHAKGHGGGGGSKGQGQAAEQAAGSPPLGDQTGHDYLASKGAAVRRAYLQNLYGPASAGTRRQDRAQSFAYVSPIEQPSLPHQLEVAWPYGYVEMGRDFMEEWQAEAKDNGLSLRLTSFRNSGWRENPVQAASMYCLKLTGDPERPDQPFMQQFLFDFAVAVSSLRLPPSPLPWREIIRRWHGEDLFLKKCLGE